MASAPKKVETTTLAPPAESDLENCDFDAMIAHILKIGDQTGTIGRRLSKRLFDSSRLDHGAVVGGVRHVPKAPNAQEHAVLHRLGIICTEFDRSIRAILGRPMPEHDA